jgi:hypothetical protein
MSHDTNETRQHFKLRNLDQDMKNAYAEASRVRSPEYVRRLKAENRGILITLAVLLAAIAVIACRLLGVF